jgi:HSP20 family protein
MRLVPYIRREMGSRQDPSRVFEEFLDDFFAPAAASSSPSGRTWIPAVDILEKEGDLILRAELPGLEEKDIELKLEGNVLTLKGERKFENKDKRENYHRVESYYGSFSRSFTLPEGADRDKISAEYKNGILTVKVPQRPEVKAREIPVSVH